MLWSLLLLACTPTEVNFKIGDSIVSFQDSLQASKLIIRDDIDSFFNVISKTDMAIQMKMSRIDISRDSMISMYKTLLQNDVCNWTSEEKNALLKLVHDAKEMLDRINPALFPKEISFIKSKGLPYGNDVYYTRENTIVIPENIFKNWNPNQQLRILIHEIYHIISRYNSVFRDFTYNNIGFRKIPKEIEIPEFLKQKMLTNPDGIKVEYAIELPNALQKRQYFVPLILTRYRSYIPGNGSYFNHMKMELFPITDKVNGGLTLQTEEGVFSAFTEDVLHDYQNKISFNTSYIIHPDEICADHFVLAVWKNENKKIPFLPPAKQTIAGDSIISQFLRTLKSKNLHIN